MVTRLRRTRRSSGVMQDLVAIAVQVGADLIHRRSLLQALQARVHELGPVKRGEIAHDDRPCYIGSFHGQQERRQRADIGCVDRQLRCVDPCLAEVSIQNSLVVFGRIGKPVDRRPR